jgi:hypothetical protein
MTMRLVAVALVAMCVVLTVAFLASLRGIAELRLRLAGVGGRPGTPRLVIGRPLPESVIEALGTLHGDSLLVLLSTTCGSCRRLAAELGRTTAPVVVCIVGDPGTTDEVQAAVPRNVPVISGAPARQIRTDLNVQTFPIAVVQRDGLIVAIGQGSGAESADALDHLWRQRAAA